MDKEQRQKEFERLIKENEEDLRQFKKDHNMKLTPEEEIQEIKKAFKGISEELFKVMNPIIIKIGKVLKEIERRLKNDI